MNASLFVTASALLATACHAASAAYVTPKMGGGQESAPMVMPNVLFDGAGLTITGVVDHHGMPIADLPVLRPLTPPDEFDPTQAWSVLSGLAYNLQYGWNLDPASVYLPGGANIWIEETASAPGLLAYQQMTYTPIFGTAGSSEKWLWDGIMAHNAYAVPAGEANWSATYRIYLGDSEGVALDGYGDASITLNWTSIPEPASLATLALGGLLLTRRRMKR